MADVLRIKRRAVGGAAGPPASLAASEVAYNEQTDILYYGGGNSAGLATSIFPIAGPGYAAPLASPVFTGIPAAPTPAPGTNTTQLATTAFVTAADIASAGVTTFNTRAGAVTLAVADITGAGGAPLASPTFTGVPAAPTAAALTNTTQVATTAFVTTATGAYLLLTGGTISNGLTISGTVGGSGVNALILTGASAYGIILNGTYTSNAIRLSILQSIGFTGTANRNLFWDNATYLPAGLHWSTGSQSAPNPVITLGDTGLITCLAGMSIDNAAATNRGVVIRSGGLARWWILGNPTEEGGSNVGTDLDFIPYDDTGAIIVNPAVRIVRATGLLSLNRGIGFATQVAPGGTTDLSRHIALYGATYGFNVTGSRLNHVAPAAASHFFVVNALDVGAFTATGLNAAAIGATTPSTGSFTTLAASGAVSGAGFTTLLAPYAPLASPTFTGVPAAPTALAGTNTTQLATTAFVAAALAAGNVTSFNTRTGAITLVAADVTGVGGALLASPVFTGTPTGPTALAGDNSTQFATTAFVTAADIVAAGVTTFNTRAGAVTLAVADITGAGGAPLASPTFTGVPAAPTAAALTNTTQLATTAFVTTAGNLKAPLASPTFTGVPAAPTAVAGTNTTQLATTAFATTADNLKAPIASPTFTGTATLPIANATALHEAAVAMPANNIDCNAGDFFTKTIAVATTFTVSNVPASGLSASFVLELTNGGAFAITWWANMRWPGGTAPTLTASGVDVLGFYTINAGTTWRGMLLAKDVK